MGRFLAFPAILLAVSIYSFWMDEVPRSLSVIGIIVSIALLVWALHETIALYKMVGLLK